MILLDIMDVDGVLHSDSQIGMMGDVRWWANRSWLRNPERW